MIKTRTWILLLGGLLLAGLLFLLRPPAEARFAEIWSDGELVCRVSLAEDQSILVESRYGTNTVTVSQGKIAVTQADCPNGECMASRLAKWGATDHLLAAPVGGAVFPVGRNGCHIRLRWSVKGETVQFSLTFGRKSGKISLILPVWWRIN